MEVSIFERLMFLAVGGKDSYLHKNGQENQQTTKLQNLLSRTMKKEPNMLRNFYL